MLRTVLHDQGRAWDNQAWGGKPVYRHCAASRNADIDIDSTVGKGTAVRLSFAVANWPALSLEWISRSPWLRRCGDILVDDDPIV